LIPAREEDALRLQVKGRNLEITDSIRSYAEQKLAKLNRQLGDATLAELELAVEKNPSIAANQVAEITVWTKGPTLRAREASEDMRASIDQLTEKLVRQVRHYRDKRSFRGSRNHNVPVDEGAPPMAEEDELEGQIVRTKTFPDKPMNAEEAVLQLELIGHDFFVFRNDDTGEINVVYKRRDGGYGLIEPQT
jgi:ribosome hibernation promoting factor